MSKLTEKHENFVIDSRRYQLVDNPTEAYVIRCLKNIPEIVNISAVTEDNNPNGNLNKPGGYTATVFFAVEYIDSKDGETLIEQGTDAGGSIEVYACVEDTIKRRDYLATFDGGLFATGTHTVVGTVLVRTSDEQTASQQKALESEVITALTYLPDIDANNLNQPENSTQVVTTAFKETMDSHAEFIDSYVAYLIKSINSTDLTIKEDYEVYVRRYYETMEQIDSINTNDLSVADCEYYNEVNSKISKKLKELEDYGINPNQPTCCSYFVGMHI